MKRTATPWWVLSEIVLFALVLHFGFDMSRDEPWGWLQDVLPAAVGLGLLHAPITILLSDIRDLLVKQARLGRKP